MLNNKWTKRFINITLILLIVFLYTKVDDSIMPVINIIGMLISPIIIGTFIYYGLRPIVKFFGDKFGHKGIFAFLTIILFLTGFTLIIVFGGAAVKTQFEDAFVLNQDKLTDYRDFLDDKINEIAPDLKIIPTIYDNIQKYITTIGKSIGNNAVGLFSSIGNIGTQFIIVFFVLFYLLKEDRQFINTLNEKLPDKNKDEIIKMEERIDDILSTYISGQLLAALVIGTLMFIGYLIIGMPNALLMGVFSLVLAVIPFLGAFLGVLPAILIAATISFSMIIKIIILAVVVQQLEGNLVTPNIMGNKLKLHPLAVIFIVIISVNLMGILGAFIGIPLYLVLVAIGKTIYRISKKNELDNEKNL